MFFCYPYFDIILITLKSASQIKCVMKFEMINTIKFHRFYEIRFTECILFETY